MEDAPTGTPGGREPQGLSRPGLPADGGRPRSRSLPPGGAERWGCGGLSSHPEVGTCQAAAQTVARDSHSGGGRGLRAGQPRVLAGGSALGTGHSSLTPSEAAGSKAQSVSSPAPRESSHPIRLALLRAPVANQAINSCPKPSNGSSAGAAIVTVCFHPLRWRRGALGG